MRVHDLTIARDFHLQDMQTLSQHASQFSSDITFRYEEEGDRRIEIDVKSLLGMMLLPIRKGTRVTVVTKGADEKEAIDFICGLLET